MTDGFHCAEFHETLDNINFVDFSECYPKSYEKFSKEAEILKLMCGFHCIDFLESLPFAQRHYVEISYTKFVLTIFTASQTNKICIYI